MNGSTGRIRIGITATVAALLVFAFISSVQATDLGPYGGPGGGQFRNTCLPDSYLTGFSARVGDWIDQLSMQCARWNAQARVLEATDTHPMPIGESHGGDPAAVFCPGGMAVYRLRISTLASKNQLVGGINFECQSIDRADGQAFAFELQGHGKSAVGPLGSFAGESDLFCPTGELAVGLFGRSGLFIDALGLICGPAPKGRVVIDPPNGLRGGRAPATSAFPKPQRFSPAPSSGNATARQIAVAAQSSAPPPFDLPEGPTPGVVTAQGVRHNYPFINDYSMAWGLLDWCPQYGVNCGAPAAKAYCSAVDGGQYPRLVEFHKFEAAGRYRPTITIVTRTQCRDSTCGAFTDVTCGK